MGATTYIPAYKGYITDVPELWFRRNDKKVFHFDQLTAANATPNVNFTEVNAGWSMYPVAYLPGQSTMEMQFTSGQFNADLFAMANAKDFQSKEEEIPVSIALDLSADGTTASIDTDTSIVNALQLPGLTKVELVDGQTLASGTYAVSETTAEVDGKQRYTTSFSFSAEDALTSMEVTYFEKRMVNILNITNDTAAIGELIAKWPVYATGDEADAAGVKGYVIMKMYRCRATAMPGFDTSYKSAATNSVTFSALEPKNRSDRAVYGIAYVENVSASNNEAVNTSL